MQNHRALLKKLAAPAFLNAVATGGRANIPAEMRSTACLLFEVSEWIRASDAADEPLRKAFVLINDVFFAEAYLQQSAKPRYIHYANIRLLDRYLMASQSRPLAERQGRARRALAIVMRDWHDFELDRLSNFDRNGQAPTGVMGYIDDKAAPEKSVTHLRERVRTLAVLRELAAVDGLPDTRVVKTAMAKHPSDWEYFAADPDRELSHFLCLPRSTWHDEAMFLRMIHATECCFAGIIAALETLPTMALGPNWLGATQVLKEATFFSDFLVKHWAVFDTMPVAHFFDGFRIDTGDASAIQSQRFQRLDVLVRGLGPRKREALSLQPEGARLATWAPPAAANLPGLIAAAQAAGPAGEDFVQAALDLEADLFTWRTKHFGVARRYLPEDTVGTGNEGIPYLKETYAQPRLTGAAEEPPQNAARERPAATFRQTSTMTLLPQQCPRLAALRVKDVLSNTVRDYVAAARERLLADITPQAVQIAQMLECYEAFFGSHHYPVTGQYGRFVKNAKLPAATAPALLLSLELRTGVLLGLHRVKPGGLISFDVATEGEMFAGISGKDMQCSANEPVVRDDKGIIASVFQGPDARTKVDFDGVERIPEIVLIVMGYPGIAQARFDAALADCRGFIAAIERPVQEEWHA